MGTSTETSLEKYQGIIVSSKHAVSFVVNNKVDVTGKKLAVVGPNTATLLGKYSEKFDDVTLVWADNAADLCELILSSFPRHYSWVFYCGDKALDIIPRTLSANKVKLKQFVVYKVEKRKGLDRELGSLLDVEIFQAVVFFSPTGVEFTSETLENKLAKECVLVAFGKSTAACISEHHGDKYAIRICDHPTPAGVLGVLLSL
jgi:uroporphyrinogen-III synthase